MQCLGEISFCRDVYFYPAHAIKISLLSSLCEVVWHYN